MELVEHLISTVSEYLPQDRVREIRDAYEFAAKAHSGQTRKSGEDFIEHPLNAAVYLADLHLDSDTIAAALLHDVIEDCNIQHTDLQMRFGTEIAKLVDGVTKLNRTDLLSEDGSNISHTIVNDPVAHSASLRKMLMSMAEDIRVVLIKLADRLHNMKTLMSLPHERRQVIAQEPLDIYAPLADRLGIWEIKWLLEDLSFQYIHEEEYSYISSLVSSKRIEREQYIERIGSIFQQELETNGLSAEITGRPKHFYSIYKKMMAYKSQKKKVNEIYDLFALRVLVSDVKECYSVLGVLHAKWRPLSGQFDDYIATPKDNLYQSLHSVVMCEDFSPVEVQIRTKDMHRVAEYGVAAHWLYKEGRTGDARFEEKMSTFRQVLQGQKYLHDDREFVESIKTDMFDTQVFVYTPTGELKELPSGSTPLDFAYRIHTEIGNGCIGAKVNGKLVQLNTPLESGDTVEIMTSKTVKGPSMDWLNPALGFVKTTSAQEKIRQWFNRQARKDNIKQGKEIFVKEFRRLNTDLQDFEVAIGIGFKSTEEFFIALGKGSISTTDVLSRLSNQDIEPDQEYSSTLPVTGPGSGIQVLGVGDLLTRMASCCSPIRGDEIIGYITRNRGVTVHNMDCTNMTNEKETERLVEVTWGQTHTMYPVRITIEAWDRIGLLGDLTGLMSEENINIASCVSEEDNDFSVISLTVYVDGINQLNRLFSKLEMVEGVIRVIRSRSLNAHRML